MSKTPECIGAPQAGTGSGSRDRKAKRAAMRRSVKLNFLPALSHEVRQPDNWLVRADDTKHALADSSILYARIVPSSGRELNDLALQLVQRICGGATQLQSFSRQLNYWCFYANKGDKPITLPVEIGPGKIVRVEYKRYTHRDSRDNGKCTWSNKSGGVNPDHMRSTNHGMGTARKGGTKRPVEREAIVHARHKRRAAPTHVVPCKTVNELLLDCDDLVVDLVQHECKGYDPVTDEQDILQCLCMNMQWSDIDADVSIICGDASI